MPRPSSQSTREWTTFAVVVGSRVYRAMLLALVAVAVAPVVIGWHAYVIKSGSMEPSIDVGDVAVSRPFTTDEEVDVGRVYTFQDPTSAGERLLVHRIVERRDDGSYSTQGDANAAPDATPIESSAIKARGVLLVPYVGLPVVWAQTGQWFLLGLWLLFTMGAFYLATRNLDGEPPKWTMYHLIRRGLEPEPRSDASESKTHTLVRGLRSVVRARSAKALAATVAVCLLGGTAFATADSAFTARSSLTGNSWTAGSWVLPYVKAVMTDGPTGFWLLDEASGAVLKDRSETYGAATAYGTVQFGRPGALPNNPGTAATFNGGRAILNPNAIDVPNDYSVELWFRTSSTGIGYLVGFENGTGATSGRADRTVLINSTGKLVVGDWYGLSESTVTTARSYNDNQWHHLVVTAAPRSSNRHAVTIYVDGANVASGSATAGGTLLISDGRWRIGSGTQSTSIFGGGTERTFRGDIDAVSIFDKVLPAARVKAHYDAR